MPELETSSDSKMLLLAAFDRSTHANWATQYPSLHWSSIQKALDDLCNRIENDVPTKTKHEYETYLRDILQTQVDAIRNRARSRLERIEGIPDPALERNQPDIIFFLATLSRLLIKNPFVALPLLASFGCQYYWQIVATLNPKHTDTTTLMSAVSVAVFSMLVSHNICSTLRKTREYHAAKEHRSRR